MLTAPGTKRLKQEHDKLLSSFASNFNLRRYNEDPLRQMRVACAGSQAIAFLPLDIPYHKPDAKKQRVAAAAAAAATAAGAGAAAAAGIVVVATVWPVRSCSPRNPTHCRLTGARAEAWCLLIHAKASPCLSLALQTHVN